MSYKLGEVPSIGAKESEKADFLEVKCLISDTAEYSITEASQAFGMIMEEDDGTEGILEELPFFDTLGLMGVREMQSNSNYPFLVSGYSVCIKTEIPQYIKDVYTFLLLATRNNMKSNRIVDGIDGSKLFEILCSRILAHYFGDKCSNSFVFGTGNDDIRSFKSKIEFLIEQLREPGYTFYSAPDDTRDQIDDKLDVVAHIPFEDARKGQFIAFCQCKTGTNWKSMVNQLQPSKFSANHITPSLQFVPISVFMVCDSITEDWTNTTKQILFFDRGRIMRYLPEENVLSKENLLDNIRLWNSGILTSII